MIITNLHTWIANLHPTTSDTTHATVSTHAEYSSVVLLISELHSTPTSLPSIVLAKSEMDLTVKWAKVFSPAEWKLEISLL